MLCIMFAAARRDIHLRDAVVELERSCAVDEAPVEAHEADWFIPHATLSTQTTHHAKLGKVFSTVFPRPPRCAWQLMST